MNNESNRGGSKRSMLYMSLGYAISRSFRLTSSVRIGESENEVTIEVNEPTSEEMLYLFDKAIGIVSPSTDDQSK